MFRNSANITIMLLVSGLVLSVEAQARVVSETVTVGSTGRSSGNDRDRDPAYTYLRDSKALTAESERGHGTPGVDCGGAAILPSAASSLAVVSRVTRGNRNELVDGEALAGSVPGPDVILADLGGVRNYGSEGGIAAFSIGTKNCNIGTERVDCHYLTNEHPIEGMSLYRLKDDRFEQIGTSWVFHWFYAVSQSFCGQCNDATDGTQLGIGCSDENTAHLRGYQTNMSPRSTINAYTGHFLYPWEGWTDPAPTSIIERRLQVRTDDLAPALNAGARYFVEAHLIGPDDAAAGTADNNASYREVVFVEEAPGTYSLAFTSAWLTQREQPAVRAWQDSDPSVVETDIRVPGEGLFILAAKATETVMGIWRYAYALQNVNSDRSGQSFRLPFPQDAIVTNIAFTDIDYHSGEPYDGTDWPYIIDDEAITWLTDSFDTNGDANALRWGTTYTFSFESTSPPVAVVATLGLFKPGTPGVISVDTIGPALGPVDCNDNGIDDRCDVDCEHPGCDGLCGGSIDCNANSVPDECEQDCNTNGVPDRCDMVDCLPGELWCADCNGNLAPDECDPDCDGDGIPDDCDTWDDTDADGVLDCFDLCSCTPGLCVCPEVGRCCWSLSLCVDDISRDVCLDTLGTPDCVELSCEDGCVTDTVDCNHNGVADIRDLMCGPGDDCEPPCGTSGDCNENGIPDECDIAEGTSSDCTSNDIPDECDIADGVASDCNDDGVPDECQEGGLADCDGDGTTDWCEVQLPDSIDCNQNWIPDECDIDDDTSADCNQNGMPDECDIDEATSADCNGNLVPDECEGPPVLYVDDDAPGGDGQSWDTALNDLQEALTIASSMGCPTAEVRVADGLYLPGASRTDSFHLVNNVAIRGGYRGPTGTGDPSDRGLESILSGDIGIRGDKTDNSYHVVQGVSVDATAIIDGFTITGGNADGLGWQDRGGGMCNLLASTPTVVDCTFRGNSARNGGGMSNFVNSNPMVLNCLFIGNMADDGGGMCNLLDSSPTVVNSTFSENSAINGGAIFSSGSTVATVTNCILWGNAPDQVDASTVVTNSSVQDDDPDDDTVYPGVGNIDDDPLFVPGPGGCLYLSQAVAGQTEQSPCVDAGSGTAVDSDLGTMTTRSDEGLDIGVVDMGFHYPVAGETLIMGDYDRDGVLDLYDFSHFQTCFTGAGTTEVPPCCRIFDFGEPDGDVDADDYAALHLGFAAP